MNHYTDQILDRVDRGKDAVSHIWNRHPRIRHAAIGSAVIAVIAANAALDTVSRTIRDSSKTSSLPERIQDSGLGAANVALGGMSHIVILKAEAAVNSSPSTSPALEAPVTGAANAAPSPLAPALAEETGIGQMSANSSMTTGDVESSFARDAAVSPPILLDTQAGGARYTQDNIPGITGGTPAP